MPSPAMALKDLPTDARPREKLLARGPAILSRDALFYDGSVDDAAKIAAKHAELTALGIVIRDSA